MTENINYIFNIIKMEELYSKRNDLQSYYDNFRKYSKIRSKKYIECKNIYNNKLRSQAFNNLFDNVLTKTFESDRFAICLGEVSVTENSISIHPTYGVAYIPSSSIKGFFKAYLKNLISLKPKCNYEQFLNELFGTEENKGILVFDDAFPIEKQYLIEIFQSAFINQTYFRSNGSDIVFDEESEVLNYPTVVNSKFQFSVYKIKNKTINNDLIEFLENLYTQQQMDIQNLTIDKLKNDFNKLLENLFANALFFQGIGAKTSVGFGSFKESTK